MSSSFSKLILMTRFRKLYCKADLSKTSKGSNDKNQMLKGTLQKRYYEKVFKTQEKHQFWILVSEILHAFCFMS